MLRSASVARGGECQAGGGYGVIRGDVDRLEQGAAGVVSMIIRLAALLRTKSVPL